jgi:hypothetical protein
VHRRGKSFIVILLHPKLLLRFRFKDAEKRQTWGLEAVPFIPGEGYNLDIGSAPMPEDLIVMCVVQLSIIKIALALE